jgi:copper chaperone CopZ
MAKLEKEYAGRATFVLLYTREFNPKMGRFAAIEDATTLEGRFALARQLKTDFDAAGRAPVWVVDAMSNALHEAYGSPKGASIVVARGGRVAFKGAWASPAAVEQALAPLVAPRERRTLMADFFVPLAPPPPPPRAQDARAGFWTASVPVRRPGAAPTMRAAPVRMQIDGMVCQGCAISIREAVLKVPAVASARLEYRADAPGELEVTVGPGGRIEDVRDAVARTGFKVVK